jgi:cystathionine beta-synthase
MFNDYWMRDQGFLPGTSYGDLRDIISRRADSGAVIAVAPSDTLLIAYSRMRLYDVSQLPVLEHGEIVGLVDESDLLLATHRDASVFRNPVREFMSTKLKMVDAQSSLESLMPLFDQGLVAIVRDHEQFSGLITRMDVLNHLRRKLS